jgi:hypothetical protein
VFDDDEAGVGSDDQAFGRDQPVRDVARVFMKHGNGRHQLANQAQRGVDIQLQLLLLRNPQNVRQPRAFKMIRDDRERRGGCHRAVHAADARVICVPEVRQAGGSLAKRELERGDGGQRRPQPQNLQELAGRAVSRDDAFTKTVGKKRRFRAIIRRKAGHDNATQCNRRTNAPNLKNGRKWLNRLHSERFGSALHGSRRLQACQPLAKTVSG